MSGIGAIINFDREPVDRELFQQLSRRLAGRGPDGETTLIRDHVGMCHRPLHTTRESWAETQPVITSDGHLLVFDGIIFNREELIDLLRRFIREGLTDAALVSIGLREFGSSFLEKVIGNFALIWYEVESDSLLIARDPFGLRPIFFRFRDSQLLVASTIESLLDVDADLSKLDDEFIASYLVSFPDPSRTPYADIQSMEPGHAIVVTKKGIVKTRIWRPERIKEERYATDSEYEQRLRELLQAGVRSALRTDGRPVWSGLSGGLDSSSIVCLADQMIERGEAEASVLNTFSLVFD